MIGYIIGTLVVAAIIVAARMLFKGGGSGCGYPGCSGCKSGMPCPRQEAMKAKNNAQLESSSPASPRNDNN